MRSTLRETFRVMGFLAIGAVLNVLVAWGFVLWTPPIAMVPAATISWPTTMSKDWPDADTTTTAQTAGLYFVYSECLYSREQEEAEQDRIRIERDLAELRAELDAKVARLTAMSGEGRSSEQDVSVAKDLLQRLDAKSDEYTNAWVRSAQAQYGKMTTGSAKLAECGWPYRSLCYEERELLITQGGTPWQSVVDLHEGLAIPKWIPGTTGQRKCDRRIPIRPMPAGFAINTLFHGGLCALIWFGAALVQSRWRVGIGCCPSCGYDLQGNISGVCPECGAGLNGVKS